MIVPAPSTKRQPGVWPWLTLAAVFLVALVLLCIVRTNPDVSWGLTMAEKWLDGGRLYVDIVEVNPPATVFLYVLPVWLARLAGLTPEVTTNVLVLLGAALSLGLCARILRPAKLVPPDRAFALLIMAAALLVVLPGQSFAEREHIALIAVLPLLAVNWVRAARQQPALPTAVVAGIGAGICAVIKPYLAIAVLCSGAAAALSARSWRVLFAIENWIAALLLAAYLIFVWLAYPVYVTDMMPLLAAVYVPTKEPLGDFLRHAALPLWTLMLFMLVGFGRGAVLKPPLSLLLAASAGFTVAYVIQQKGWPNHSYPMLALALLALGYVLAGERERTARLIGAIPALAVAGLTFAWMNKAQEHPGLVAPIRAIAPHAKVLLIGADLTIGHPAVREADGVWVSRVSALWMTQGALMARARGGDDPALAARLDSYADLDRRMLTEDIAKNRPDVILVQHEPGFDWLVWARSVPALAAELAAYGPEATIGEVTVLRRLRRKSEHPHTHLAAP